MSRRDELRAELDGLTWEQREAAWEDLAVDDQRRIRRGINLSHWNAAWNMVFVITCVLGLVLPAVGVNPGPLVTAVWFALMPALIWAVKRWFDRDCLELRTDDEQKRSGGADPEDLPSSTDTADDCLDWFFGALTETIQRNGVKLWNEELALLVSDASKALARQRTHVVAMRPRLTMLLIQAIEADKTLGGRLVGVPSGMAVPMSWKLRYDILSKSSDQSVLLYALDELFTGESMGILLPA